MLVAPLRVTQYIFRFDLQIVKNPIFSGEYNVNNKNQKQNMKVLQVYLLPFGQGHTSRFPWCLFTYHQRLCSRHTIIGPSPRIYDSKEFGPDQLTSEVAKGKVPVVPTQSLILVPQPRQGEAIRQKTIVCSLKAVINTVQLIVQARKHHKS